MDRAFRINRHRRPSSGAALIDQPSWLTRINGANVLPPSRDTVKPMSRMLPANTCRHAA
jgi:hypothetical protein